MKYTVTNNAKGTNIKVGTNIKDVQWRSDDFGLANLSGCALWVHRSEVKEI